MAQRDGPIWPTSSVHRTLRYLPPNAEVILIFKAFGGHRGLDPEGGAGIEPVEGAVPEFLHRLAAMVPGDGLVQPPPHSALIPDRAGYRLERLRLDGRYFQESVPFAGRAESSQSAILTASGASQEPVCYRQQENHERNGRTVGGACARGRRMLAASFPLPRA